ncbi:MAG: hypothetical protein ACJ8D0_14500, partial [Xanthobacteraceae bacterium]
VIEAAAALKLVLYFSLLICMFVPFGMATAEKTPQALAIGIAAYLAKLIVLAVALPIGETAVAKMRVFRYPVFLGGAFAAARSPCPSSSSRRASKQVSVASHTSLAAMCQKRTAATQQLLIHHSNAADGSFRSPRQR